MAKPEEFLPLFADDSGQVMEHPGLSMLGRSGMEWVEPVQGEMMPLPRGAVLVTVPGQKPVAGAGGQARVIDQAPGGGSAHAVAALLPQGFTRTLLPAGVSPQPHAILPLQGYAAIGFKSEKIWVAAVQSDEHRKWHPRFYSTPHLPQRIEKLMARYPDNRIIQQLGICAMRYGCFTAQNIFYGRWEGGIPTMTACNADCIGCISEGHITDDAPQQRLQFIPTVNEISEVGTLHLTRAREGIISFGQGCEGEPSLNAETIAAALVKIRHNTRQGTININTNAGFTEGIAKLSRTGLDSMRVTIFSCREDNYNQYHRPRNYDLGDVENSVRLAKDSGVLVSLNLLVFPGFTDCEAEIEALMTWVQKNGVDMIQLRNLNMDPNVLFRHVSAEGEVLGINNFLYILQQELPGLRLGSYSHPVIAGE